ncbi:MAG: hypothetical protein ACR2J3_06085 [Aridibacter sp.]
MKFTPRFTIISLAVGGSILALANWSSRIGRKVWSPKVFAWRNPFKPQPIFEKQPNCPVRFVRPRFYSFMSIGSSIGSVLNIDLVNISNKPIHSFMVSYHSSEPADTGASGCELESLLQPKQFYTIGNSSDGDDRVTFSIDFVQFADGDVWFASPPRATVKPEGVKLGFRAALDYLRELLELEGASAVLDVLPRIRSKMSLWKFPMEEDLSSFGFHYGITKAVVSVQYAYKKGGLSEIGKFLMKQN